MLWMQCRPTRPSSAGDVHSKRFSGPMPAPPGKSAVTVREAVEGIRTTHGIPARGFSLVRLDKPLPVPPAEGAPARQLQRENKQLTRLYVEAVTRLKESAVRLALWEFSGALDVP